MYTKIMVPVDLAHIDKPGKAPPGLNGHIFHSNARTVAACAPASVFVVG